MKSNSRDFSDVSKAYNTNAFLLNDSRKAFETEIRRLNDMTAEFLGTAVERLNKDETANTKVRWNSTEDKSTQKDGPWLNFIARTETSINVKTPTNKNFRKNVAYLIFETVFDWDSNQFVFRCRFENENIVGDNLDEKLIECAQKKSLEFSSCQHFKASTAIVFKRELNSDLLENLNQYVNNSVDLVVEMVNEVYPDSMYSSAILTETGDCAK